MHTGCPFRLLCSSSSLIQHLSKNALSYRHTGRQVCVRYFSPSSYNCKCIMGQSLLSNICDGNCRCMCDRKCIRQISTSQCHPSAITEEHFVPKTHMSSWHIHQYGSLDELMKSDTSRLPHIKHPHEVLVEVHAASVNQIDVNMIGGYGNVLLNVIRSRLMTKPGTEFPLILGRDFSGVVVETGKSVIKFKPGDQVWGAVNIDRAGTHAEFIVTSDDEISHKPVCLSHTQAASIPYVACTTWAGLVDSANLTEQNTPGMRTLVYGGSGGMGTFVIQLLKAWGAEVTTTCSTDAVDLCYSLGADHVIDYRTQDVLTELQRHEFDLIFDNVGNSSMLEQSLSLLKPWSGAKYLSPVTPLLHMTDELGIISGLIKVGGMFAAYNVQSLQEGKCVHWVLFRPNGSALDTIAQLLEKEKIVPVVDKVFTFDEIPEAYGKVNAGHNRGKTVIKRL